MKPLRAKNVPRRYLVRVLPCSSARVYKQAKKRLRLSFYPRKYVLLYPFGHSRGEITLITGVDPGRLGFFPLEKITGMNCPLAFGPSTTERVRPGC